VEVIDGGCESAVANKISALTADGYGDAFFVGDLGDIVCKHQAWLTELPRVEPFYAVNCNDDPLVLSVLAKLGTGFACVNKAEMQTVLGLDVRASRLMFVNPCKQSTHIQWAARHAVDIMTFDSELELVKIKAKHPSAELLMRVIMSSGCHGNVAEAGMQLGCHMKQVPQLLAVARQLDLDVIGLSFHMEPNCEDSVAFVEALASARAIFDLAAVEGYHFQLLDIGDGFPAGLSFHEIAAALRHSLDQYFPADDGVRVIAEVGRYFVSSAFTFAANIVARRTLDCSSADDMSGMSSNVENFYYINDGVYGSFSCRLAGQDDIQPSLVDEYRFHCERRYKSSVFGPTLDDLDCVVPRCSLPQLEAGDWLVFGNMGAYSIRNAALPGTPECHYIISAHLWDQLNISTSSCER